MGLGFGLGPYIRERAPMSECQYEELVSDSVALAGNGPDSQPLTSSEVWDALANKQLPRFAFRDLKNPLIFGPFSQAVRLTFALYADAAGVMTPQEFRCALHHLVDIAVAVYGRRNQFQEGKDFAAPARARAAAVRKLTERIALGA